MDIEAIFKEYYPQLKYFGKRYIEHSGVVEDIVVDAIIKVSKRECRNVSAMLYTSVKNGCIDYIKKRSKEREGYVFYSEDVYTESDQLETELLNKMYLIIRDLQPHEQRLLNLFFYEKKSSGEVAEILKKTPSTVRTLKQLLLLKMRKLITKMGDVT